MIIEENLFKSLKETEKFKYVQIDDDDYYISEEDLYGLLEDLTSTIENVKEENEYLSRVLRDGYDEDIS